MRQPSCSGTVFIYSGRPDPEWLVAPGQLRLLRELWERLPPSDTPPRRAPLLGYRGCGVRCASGEEWFAYEGIASLTRRPHRPDHRRDVERRFERQILKSAPPGTIPEAVRSAAKL